MVLKFFDAAFFGSGILVQLLSSFFGNIFGVVFFVFLLFPALLLSFVFFCLVGDVGLALCSNYNLLFILTVALFFW